MGDDGLAAWYRGQHPTLVAALAIIARDPALARDVVDEAFVRAYEAPHGRDHPGTAAFSWAARDPPGTWFQAGQGGIDIGVCEFRSDHPENEVQGDPRYGATPCAYPYEGMGVVADASGTVTVPNFPLRTTRPGSA